MWLISSMWEVGPKPRFRKVGRWYQRHLPSSITRAPRSVKRRTLGPPFVARRPATLAHRPSTEGPIARNAPNVRGTLRFRRPAPNVAKGPSRHTMCLPCSPPNGSTYDAAVTYLGQAPCPQGRGPSAKGPRAKRPEGWCWVPACPRVSPLGMDRHGQAGTRFQASKGSGVRVVRVGGGPKIASTLSTCEAFLGCATKVYTPTPLLPSYL
jgi:hypothetical protein